MPLPSEDRVALFRALPHVVVLAPFAAYLLTVLLRVEPVILGDSLTILWEGPVTGAFWTQRLLTSRLLAFLLGNNVRLYAVVQLGFLAWAAWELGVGRRGSGHRNSELESGNSNLGRGYCIRTGGAGCSSGPAWRVARAGLVALLFTSWTLNIVSALVLADPLAIALFLLFPLHMFRARPGWLCFVLGLLTIGVRTVGGLYVGILCLLRMSAALRFPGRRRLALLACVLWGLAVLHAGMLVRMDSAVHVSMANRYLGRIFRCHAAVDWFAGRAGMPTGSWVRASGPDVLRGIDGVKMVRYEPAVRNAVLQDDAYGFVRWMREHGVRAYWGYTLTEGLADAWHEVGDALCRDLSGGALGVLPGYLQMESVRPDRARNRVDGGGALGFDLLVLLSRALAWIGLADPLVGMSLGLIAALAGIARGAKPASGLSALAGASVIAALVAYAAATLGDTLEHERHVLPALLVYVLAAWSCLAAVAAFLVRRLRMPRCTADQRSIR